MQSISEEHRQALEWFGRHKGQRILWSEIKAQASTSRKLARGRVLGKLSARGTLMVTQLNTTYS